MGDLEGSRGKGGDIQTGKCNTGSTSHGRLGGAQGRNGIAREGVAGAAWD